MKILIVEDDFTSRYGLQLILEKYGKCFSVVNGEEALEIFVKEFEKGDPFDLVCLDIMMPKMDGQEVLRRIRSFERKKDIEAFEYRVKILMITALNDYTNIKEAFWEICDDYLIKPIEEKDIFEKLKKLQLL